MKLIYRILEMLKLPFAVYTDPSNQLHDALGLYKTSGTQPESPSKQTVGRSYSKRGRLWAPLRVAVRIAAAKVTHLGGGSDSGDPEQLGGEFVFGPG